MTQTKPAKFTVHSPLGAPERDTRKVCSRLGLAFFIMMLVWRGANLGLTFLASEFLPSYSGEDMVAMLAINDIALYLLALPVLLLILRTIPNKKTDEPARPIMKMNVWKYLLAIVFCLGIMYFFNLIATVIIGFIELVKTSINPQQIIDMLEQSENLPTETNMLDMFSVGIGWRLFFIGIVPAFGEEFVFRYLIRRKLRGAGDRVYILVSGFCFGLFHANFQQAVYATILGVVFAWLYVSTGKIWYPISLHFIVNVMGSIFVPSLLENEVALVVYMLLVLVMAIGAAILFILKAKKFWRLAQPPTEAGWPYKIIAPKKVYMPASYYNRPPVNRQYFPQYPYAAPARPYYGGYAVQQPYNPYYVQPPAYYPYAAPYAPPQYAPAPGVYPQYPAYPPQYVPAARPPVPYIPVPAYPAAHFAGSSPVPVQPQPPVNTAADNRQRFYYPQTRSAATGDVPLSFRRKPYTPPVHGVKAAAAVVKPEPPVLQQQASPFSQAAAPAPTPVQEHIVLDRKGKKVGVMRMSFVNVGMLLFIGLTLLYSIIGLIVA